MSSSAYFEVPKILDTHPRYSGLSIEARYLYARMRDTLKLSILNGWRDSAGYYIRMTRDKMAALLHRSLPTIRKIIRELIGAGLLREKREGLTRSNRLYVQMVEGESEAAFRDRLQRRSRPEKSPAFSTDGNGLAPNNRNLSNPYIRGVAQDRKPPARAVPAQQYTQRAYTGAEFAALFEDI